MADPQEVRDALDLAPALGSPKLLDAQGVLDVVAHRHVWIKRVALEDERDIAVLRLEADDAPPVDADVAAIGMLEASEHAQRGGLPAPGRPEQHEKLAVGDVQRQPAHGGRIARGELLPDIVVFNLPHD